MVSFSPYSALLGCLSKQSEVTEAQMAEEVLMPEMSKGHPRHVLMRASLHQANVQGAGLRALARSIRAEDGQQAPGLLPAMADVATPGFAHATDWGHGDASFWLRNTVADEKTLRVH